MAKPAAQLYLNTSSTRSDLCITNQATLNSKRCTAPFLKSASAIFHMSCSVYYKHCCYLFVCRACPYTYISHIHLHPPRDKWDF